MKAKRVAKRGNFASPNGKGEIRRRDSAREDRLIRRLLEKAGITLEGKRGPHTFRHARAVSLLRASVPVKTIGDALGHRSAASTKTLS